MKRRRIGRYHTQRESLIFEASDFDEDGLLKERAFEFEAFTDWSFLARAERLSARAGAFLRERGLPDCRGVIFPPGKPEEWEACEDSLDSLRLSPRREWSRIDCYLREYRGVRDEEAEDLAARIVCAAYEIKQARNNDVAMLAAYKLGELAVLSHIYAEEDRRRKRDRKTMRAVWDELRKDLGDVSSPEEAWSSIHEEEEGAHRIVAAGVRWLVYRDGDYLCAVNDRTGVLKSIKRATFLKYLTRKVSG